MTTEVKTGMLKSNGSSVPIVNIRHAANGAIKTTLSIGTQVSVIKASAELDINGFKWYQISFGIANELGWVREDLIDLKDEPKGREEKAEVATAENTRLFFETSARSVRVFQGSERLHMNIHDKSSGKTQQVGAIRLPDAVNVPKGADAPWQSYVAEHDGKVYATRFVPLRQPSPQAELVVSHASNGSFISKEPGFKIEGTAYT